MLPLCFVAELTGVGMGVQTQRDIAAAVQEQLTGLTSLVLWSPRAERHCSSCARAAGPSGGEARPCHRTIVMVITSTVTYTTIYSGGKNFACVSIVFCCRTDSGFHGCADAEGHCSSRAKAAGLLGARNVHIGHTTVITPALSSHTPSFSEI